MLNDLQQIQLNLQNAITGSKEFNQAISQLNSAEMKSNIDAQLYLSWVYSQRGALKNATQKAFKICQQIASQTGHPLALARMADLLLWGVGIEKDEKQSFQIYQQLANQGMLPLTTLASLYSHGIGTERNELEATNCILKAAAQGDTLAFMLLAYRFEIGLGVPINGVLAKAYASLAAKRNFPSAETKLFQLNIRFASIDNTEVEKVIQSLINNIQNLSEKVNQLTQSIAPNNPEFSSAYMQVLINNLNQLNINDLSINPKQRGYALQYREIKKPLIQIISDSPKLLVIRDFVDFEECQYLIDQSVPMLESTAKQMKRKTNSEVDAFSGDSAILSAGQISPTVRVVQERLAKATKTPVTHFEPISVLKYLVGHEYSTHTDAFDEARIAEHEEKCDFGGQRITTNLIYLLPPITGGQTHYQSIDYTITGEVGMAVIHYNATDDFKADVRSLHTGKEILEGEKWLLRTATRQYPLYGTNKI